MTREVAKLVWRDAEVKLKFDLTDEKPRRQATNRRDDPLYQPESLTLVFRRRSDGPWVLDFGIIQGKNIQADGSIGKRDVDAVLPVLHVRVRRDQLPSWREDHKHYDIPESVLDAIEKHWPADEGAAAAREA